MAKEEGGSESRESEPQISQMAQMKNRRAFVASACPERTGGVEQEDREDREGRRRGIREI
ncbi:MAG: hypothetical protein ACKPB0_00420 [Opitutaceae bacterium]